MSRCTDCGFDWQMRHEEVLPFASPRVPRYRNLVSPFLESGAGSEALQVRPSEGVWSPLEYLGHMRDVTEFFADRIQRILTEDHPVLHVRVGFSELAELRSYQTEDPPGTLAGFEEQASIFQEMLSDLDEHQWEREGIGSGGDRRTVLMLARRFAHEVHHHLLDLEAQIAPTA